MLEASMVVVGDEILGGYVTDTNSPFLADRLRAHGVPFTRAHVVPDTMEAIGEAIQAELQRGGPRVVVTSGGIGSTPDDLTYEAVAAALDRDLVEDPVIGERIAGAVDWSREQGIGVDDTFVWHLGRMARIPADARLLQREGGWAVAVALDVDGGSDEGGTTIVILPGVPSEFRALLEQAVEPALLVDRNQVPVVRELEHTFPESALNRTFIAMQERWPGVKLGSYPGRPMLVRLAGERDEVDAAAAFVSEAIAALEASPAGRRRAADRARRAAGSDAGSEAEDDAEADAGQDDGS